ncbi:hypothetical protein MRX96_032703 [Rhipicephalus microplus]
MAFTVTVPALIMALEYPFHNCGCKCSIVHLPLSLSLLALVLSGIADSFFGPGQWSRVFGSLIEPVGTFQNSRLQAARRGSRHPAKKTVWRTLGGAFLRGLGVIAFNFASH